MVPHFWETCISGMNWDDISWNCGLSNWTFGKPQQLMLDMFLIVNPSMGDRVCSKELVPFFSKSLPWNNFKLVCSLMKLQGLFWPIFPFKSFILQRMFEKNIAKQKNLWKTRSNVKPFLSLSLWNFTVLKTNYIVLVHHAYSKLVEKWKTQILPTASIKCDINVENTTE